MCDIILFLGRFSSFICHKLFMFNNLYDNVLENICAMLYCNKILAFNFLKYNFRLFFNCHILWCEHDVITCIT